MSEILLLKGPDEVLLADAAIEAVNAVIGAADRTEVLDELSGDDYTVADVVLAASSVSMFGERVVVARNASRFVSAEWAPLLTYLADPNPTSSVIIVWDKPLTGSAKANPAPKKLTDAIKAAGGRVDDIKAPANARARDPWLDAQLASSSISLNAGAKRLMVERLGEDLPRVPGLLRLFESSFPASTTLGPNDIEPFLGPAGGVPPWDLTDAIDGGKITLAVDVVRRMCGGGERHPLQVMASLSTHVERWCRLDGSGATSEAAAAEVLGIKGFPARKALDQATKLGSERIAGAMRLVSQADVDLRGMTAVPAEATIEVLVARLAQLSKR